MLINTTTAYQIRKYIDTENTKLAHHWHIHNNETGIIMIIFDQTYMAQCKTAMHPLLTQWGYCSLVLIPCHTPWYTGPRFNIKMVSSQYRKSHCGDKTILRPSYLHNGISYTGKTTSLYWIGALIPKAVLCLWPTSPIVRLPGKSSL